MRYFRATESVYEQARAALDAAWGHPTADGRTFTCIEPAATAPRDANGRIVLAVDNEFCQYEAAAAMLPQLLASGAVEEITAEQYHAVLAPSLQTAPASAFPGGTTTINGTLGGRTFGL